MDKPMMKCGHAANAITMGSNKPCCAICVGIHQGAEEVDDNPPDLTGRMARCAYRNCQSKQKSITNLPFFESKPNEEYDEYYCGCRGWD